MSTRLAISNYRRHGITGSRTLQDQRSCPKQSVDKQTAFGRFYFASLNFVQDKTI